MKIIDLLNKIANGEEVPKKIRVNKILYEYQGDDYLYKDKKEYWLFSAGYTDKFEWLDSFLNTEVEILEEEKKPKPLTKKDIETLGYACGEIQKCFTNGWTKSLENKPFEEEKKIPEKIPNSYYHENDDVIKDMFKCRINDIIDYLKSKGE